MWRCIHILYMCLYMFYVLHISHTGYDSMCQLSYKVYVSCASNLKVTKTHDTGFSETPLIPQLCLALGILAIAPLQHTFVMWLLYLMSCLDLPRSADTNLTSTYTFFVSPPYGYVLAQRWSSWLFCKTRLSPNFMVTMIFPSGFLSWCFK